MKKLLVLVLVAALCIPCYGAPLDENILVYKLTCSFKPMIDFNDTRTQATVGTKKINGYLIFDLDLLDANTPLLNFDPVMILYAKDEKDPSTWWGTYFTLHEASGEVGFYVFDIDEKGHNGIYLYIDGEADYDIVHNVRCGLYGKITSVDIGKVTGIPPGVVKKSVSGILKGNVEVWDETVNDFEGFGDMTATLDRKYTKPANKLPQDQDTVRDAIVGDLEEQGYIFP